AVPCEARNSAFVTVDSVHHPVQAALHERIDVFGIGALRKRRKAHGVREQYCNRAPFPFELGALAQDLLSQVLGRVRERVRGGRCRLHRRQPLSAASAERTVCAVASLAGHADDLELRAALVTEGGVRGVLVSARWAVHSTTILLRIPVYERVNRAQTDRSLSTSGPSRLTPVQRLLSLPHHDRQPLQPPEARYPPPLERRLRAPHLREALHQRSNSDLRLRPRQRCAEAEVHTTSERMVVSLLACYVEPVGLGVY